VNLNTEDIVEIVAEILTEAKQFTIADFEAHERTAGNGGWLDIRKAAREELIRHLERTFGGL